MAYADAKAKVWRSEVAVLNADDPAVQALAERSAVRNAVSFSLAAPRPGQYGISDGLLVRAGQTGQSDERFGEVSAIRPSGTHNVGNALAAIALAGTVGVGEAAIVRGLAEFEPDPHRNQFIARVAGVDYVDDSKATNPHAAAAALAAYPRVVWIAGGQLKGADIDPLVGRYADRLVGAVLLGIDRGLVAAAIARHAPDLPVITIDRTDHGAMTDVVRAAASLAQPGDVVLLAPAAASKDMFIGYDVRGRAFAAAVEAVGTGFQR
jgi:UDP-N-acetylmuramoylalanine--D-glutamate ligase